MYTVVGSWLSASAEADSQVSAGIDQILKFLFTTHKMPNFGNSVNQKVASIFRAKVTITMCVPKPAAVLTEREQCHAKAAAKC